MRTWSVLMAFFLTIGWASAQSLKPEEPAPLKPGINTGTVDNFVGTQYWYFIGDPGETRIVARFKAMGVLGAPMRTPLTITVYDEKKTWRTRKVLTSEQNATEATLNGKLDKKQKIII